MTVTYGSTTAYGGYFWQIGVEGAVSDVNATTGEVTVYSKVYVKCTSSSEGVLSTGTWRAYVDGTLEGSGSAAGTGYNTYGREVGFGSATVTASYTGTSTLNVAGNLDVIAGATQSVTIPIRPPQLPSAATAASATYVSDSQTNVAWTRPADASAASNIWSQTEIERWRQSTGVWARVALLTGTPTSWSDTTTSADDRYQYRVRGVNVTGGGGWETTGYVSTTPATPTGVTAAKSGSDIVVSWTDQSRAETGFEVQDETTTVGTPTSSPFTDVAPSNLVTHRYRVRAVADGPRYSAWSTYSNTVALSAAPAAPSDLYPNGQAISLDDDLVLSWRHNPVDTTAQTAFEVQHREVGAGTWTTVSGTTADSLTVTAYTGEADVEWQVRTKGGHVDWSPWSALATFTVTATPTVTLTAPDATIDVPYVSAAWTFAHAGGSAQSAWEAQVVRSGTVIDSGAGTGTTATWTSDNVLDEGDTITTRVRVRETNGLWSEWDEVESAVSFPQPAESTVSAAWIDGEGYVLVTATAGAEDGKPATVSHSVERSTDGTTWTMVADGLGTNVAVTDYEAPAAGTYYYRVSAYSEALAVIRTTVTVTVAATSVNDLVWIGGGTGFAQLVKIAHNPALSYQGGRERVLNTYDGRTLPVETSSIRTPRSLSVAGTILSDTDPDRADFEDVFDLPGPHLYRDALGRVLYGSLSELSWSRDPGTGIGSVQFSITKSSRGTDAQLAAIASLVEVI